MFITILRSPYWGWEVGRTNKLYSTLAALYTQSVWVTYLWITMLNISAQSGVIASANLENRYSLENKYSCGMVEI